MYYLECMTQENMKENLSSYYSDEDVPPAYIVYSHAILWGSGETQEEALADALGNAQGDSVEMFLYAQVEGWDYECRGELADL
jgi:hypothetical protein